MKIAVASQNFRTVTGHAGKTRRWLVFDMQETGMPAEIDRIDLPKDMSLHDWSADKGPHPLFSMDAVLVGSCGEGFPRRMARHGVRAAVAVDSDPAAAVKHYVESGALEQPLPDPAEVAGESHGHGGCSCTCGGQ